MPTRPLVQTAILDVTGAAVYVRSARAPFEFTFVSDNASDIVGVAARELLLSTSVWSETIHPDDAGTVLDDLAAIDPGDVSLHRRDYRVREPGKGFRWIRDAWRVVRDGSGVTVVGAWTNITDWKRSGQALARSHRRLQALFQYALDGILLIGDDAHIIEANPAASDLTGYTHADLLKRTMWDLIAPDLQDVSRTVWAKFLATGESGGELVARRADGTFRDIEYRAVAHVLPGTHLAHIRDITARKQAETKQQQYVNRLEVLSDIDRGILAAKSPEAVADAVLPQISRLIQCARAIVNLFDPKRIKGVNLAVWTMHSSSRGAGAEVPIQDYRQLDDLLAGRSVAIHDLSDAASLSTIERMLVGEGFRAYMAVPLRTKQTTIGALILLTSVPWTPSSEQQQIAREIADRLAVAIANARLAEESQTSGDQLARISRNILEVQETERREIARELHDEIGQVLTGLKLGLNVAARKADASVAESLSGADKLVDDLITQVRRLSLNLRPPALDELGLLSALLWHFERFTTQSHIAVQFTHAGLDRRFSIQTETAVYRVVQESLTNVARHAGVMAVGVDVQVADGVIRVRIVDAGRGFDLEEVRRERRTLGLLGMDERIKLLGGRFGIVSTPEAGTCVEAEIPCDD